MSDLIDRQKAIDEINKLEYPSSLVDVKRIIVDLPSAQTEIIRCRDCKHHHRDNSGAYYCGRKDYGYGWGLNDFCSRAERRKG